MTARAELLEARRRRSCRSVEQLQAALARLRPRRPSSRPSASKSISRIERAFSRPGHCGLSPRLAAMDGRGRRELPIFELPLVLLPGELVPLHIFEERYKAMIGHCLDRGEPFGIVFRDPTSAPGESAARRRITEVHRALRRRAPEHRRHRRAAVPGPRPPRRPARTRPARSSRSANPPAQTDAGRRGGDTRPAPASPSSSSGSAANGPADAELEALDSYGLAAKVELPTDTKQHLLELRSEPERMKVLAAALDALVVDDQPFDRDRRARPNERQGLDLPR